MIGLVSANYWTADLNESLTYYYKFDGDLTDYLGVTDMTGSGDTNCSGVLGSGRNVSGTNYVQRTAYGMPSNSNDRTFNIWFYFNAIDGGVNGNTILSYGS